MRQSPVPTTKNQQSQDTEDFSVIAICSHYKRADNSTAGSCSLLPLKARIFRWSWRPVWRSPTWQC